MSPKVPNTRIRSIRVCRLQVKKSIDLNVSWRSLLIIFYHCASNCRRLVEATKIARLATCLSSGQHYRLVFDNGLRVVGHGHLYVHLNRGHPRICAGLHSLQMEKEYQFHVCRFARPALVHPAMRVRGDSQHQERHASTGISLLFTGRILSEPPTLCVFGRLLSIDRPRRSQPGQYSLALQTIFRYQRKHHRTVWGGGQLILHRHLQNETKLWRAIDGGDWRARHCLAHR